MVNALHSQKINGKVKPCYTFVCKQGGNAESIRLLTETKDIFSFEVVVTILQSDIVPEEVRTMFCRLITCKSLEEYRGSALFPY